MRRLRSLWRRADSDYSFASLPHLWFSSLLQASPPAFRFFEEGEEGLEWMPVVEQPQISELLRVEDPFLEALLVGECVSLARIS